MVHYESQLGGCGHCLNKNYTNTSLRVQLTSLAALKLRSSKILHMTYLHIREVNQRKTLMSVLPLSYYFLCQINMH